MRVELDIFSGRPNPTWEMSPEEAAEFHKRLTTLIRTEKPSDPPGLGYRGFVVSNSDALAGTRAEIRVCQGVLTIKENGSYGYYKDLNEIEKWLLQQARGRGYGDILIRVG